MIDHHLLNDPVDKHPHRIAPRVMETKIKPRIAKIAEKATHPTTNFESQCNALESLGKVAEAVVVNSVKSGVGINIMGYFFHNGCIEEAMLAILGAMTDEERKESGRSAVVRACRCGHGARMDEERLRKAGGHTVQAVAGGLGYGGVSRG
jgi:hypothetical protein